MTEVWRGLAMVAPRKTQPTETVDSFSKDMRQSVFAMWSDHGLEIRAIARNWHITDNEVSAILREESRRILRREIELADRRGCLRCGGVRRQPALRIVTRAA